MEKLKPSRFVARLSLMSFSSYTSKNETDRAKFYLRVLVFQQTNYIFMLLKNFLTFLIYIFNFFLDNEDVFFFTFRKVHFLKIYFHILR